MMRENTTLISDLLKMGENALGNLLAARHEFGAQAKSRLGTVTQKLQLVSREEFDVALAMIAKARTRQEELEERIVAIEKRLKIKVSGRKDSAAPAPKTARAKKSR